MLRDAVIRELRDPTTWVGTHDKLGTLEGGVVWALSFPHGGLSRAGRTPGAIATVHMLAFGNGHNAD